MWDDFQTSFSKKCFIVAEKLREMPKDEITGGAIIKLFDSIPVSPPRGKERKTKNIECTHKYLEDTKTKRKGEMCKNKQLKDSEFCATHSKVTNAKKSKEPADITRSKSLTSEEKKEKNKALQKNIQLTDSDSERNKKGKNKKNEKKEKNESGSENENENESESENESENKGKPSFKTMGKK